MLALLEVQLMGFAGFLVRKLCAEVVGCWGWDIVGEYGHCFYDGLAVWADYYAVQVIHACVVVVIVIVGGDAVALIYCDLLQSRIGAKSS